MGFIMRLNFILAAAVVALLTLPGMADQFGRGPGLDSQLVRLAAAQAELGATLDPNAEPRLSIVLPADRSALAALISAP